MSLDGDHALLNVVTGEGPGTLLFMDLASGKVIRRIELAPQARADPS
ncbi:hypothetical protein [Faunimonas pinastri]|nr:hypothetical protein [Faunimonas pinastri]